MNDVEISKYLGISIMTLSRWNNNSVMPSFESLEKVYKKIYDSGNFDKALSTNPSLAESLFSKEKRGT